ncbi:sugar transferase [Roseinatronobacter sp. NSM]|uniref:sugar transferase n=1 Tax=Roseinatronobacter sp. NSM TaxID=3457785 RepID=UPI004035AC1F
MKHLDGSVYFDNAEEVGASVGATRIASNSYSRYAKRVVDLLIAVALVPIIAPVIAVLWVLVRREGGAGFFGHARVGRDGKLFKCWKIRTMVPDAEQKLKEYLNANPAAAQEWRENFKLENDPRITRLGAFLRKSSLDELPQLWNVIKGEMSFVGPRPVTRDELDMYAGYEDAYLSQRPGITGLWQVSGRNDISYQQRVALDVQYAERASMLWDLSLMVKTGLSVLRMTGR